MTVLGGIDNASRAGRDDDMALYHLIFTEDRMISVRVMKRKEEFDRERTRIDYKPNGVVTWTTSTIAKEVHMRLYEEAIKRGTSIQDNLEEYLESNPEWFETVHYSTITRVEFSKGTMFAMPYIRLIQSNIQIKYNLLRNIFEKAGKIEDDVFKQYRETLKKAFGNRLIIKV